MNAIEAIRRQFATVGRLCQAPLNGITAAEFDFAPPGTANTPSANLIHYAGTEDYFVQELLQGRPQVWETGGWAEKVGVAKRPNQGESWDYLKTMSVPVEPSVAYADAVRAATLAYIDGLTEAELEREIDMGGRTRQVVDILALVGCHSVFHAGEISAIKGVAGGRGIPF